MRCPACGSYDSFDLIDLGKMPLSVLHLPSSPDRTIPVYDIKMKTCKSCTHVFNDAYCKDFDQCSHGSCTMYNAGAAWHKHMRAVASIVDFDSPKLVVEVGGGSGEFASMLQGKCIVFEPGDCVGFDVDCRPEYFTPEYLTCLAPDTIVMRHVLEHFADPGEFLSALSQVALPDVKLIIEVPCIETAIATGRLEDWVYEHPQHFTSRSLSMLLKKSGWRMTVLRYMYNREVLVVTASPSGIDTPPDLKDTYNEFQKTCNSLMKFVDDGNSLALWGGAGKGSVMINLMKFPPGWVFVVDSDLRKVGKYVPGTGHQIGATNTLKSLKPDLIIATTSWRVGDIHNEILSCGIPCKRLASIVNGKLRTYEG